MIRQKSTILILGIIAIILLVPLVAMQVSTNVNWSVGDFVVAAALLLGVGFGCRFILQKNIKTQFKIMACIALVLMLAVVWAEIAVGIIGV